jgi:predicted peptidase
MNLTHAGFALAALVIIPFAAELVFAEPGNAGSGSASTRQQAHTIALDAPHHVDLQYLLFLPEDYEKSTDRWPLILYLHGGSLRGEDIAKMKRWGLNEKVEVDPHFPFVVVSPQCH